MAEIKKDKAEIIYYTDPLCCWSWVFEEDWQRFKKESGDQIHWRYCMGGLLPDWKHFHDTLNSVSRPIQMGPVWMHASQVGNVPINHIIWHKDPPSSSYPACVAVKAAELQSAEAADCLLSQLRKSCMTNGLNIAKKKIIFQIVKDLINDGALALDYDLFVSDFINGRALEKFRDDVQETRYNEIHRFPTLMIRAGKQSHLLTGAVPYDTLTTLLAESKTIK